MKTTKGIVCGLVLALATGVGVLLAQGQAPKQQVEQKAPEVFCDGLSPGQLCLSNAPKVLRLDDAQKQRWTEAARQYNKAVDAATKQFLEQSKPILSPGQFASMQKWFDAGLNPVLNQVLSTQSSSK
ncbi:MAG: hypothetical protein U0Q11_17900 [Vicinamibacterales bacterium]|jgi:hypothetical protein